MRPGRPGARGALAAAVFLAPAGAQLRIVAPEGLAQSFNASHGIVYGTTATFGAPYYGERVLGQLLFGESAGRQHCTADDYKLAPPKARTPPGQEGGEAAQLVNVVLVRRGGCTFVTKVQVAQDTKEAHAVIVVDKETSKLSSEEIQQIVMADDGWGHKVRIPSMLVSRSDGQRLIDAAKRGPVVVELAWDIPRGHVVTADFWMSSGSRESSQFLERFRDSAETLKYRLQFVPHFHVFSLPQGASYNRLCVERIDGCDDCRPAADRYCATDPDGPGAVTGGHVANEDLRQLCIWNTTARQAAGDGALYSEEYWNYVVEFRSACPHAGKREANRFGFQCSQAAMEKVGISWDKVRECVRQNYQTFLDEQVERVAWSSQALRINGWRYSGPLDPENVLTAICNGYASPPTECEELQAGYKGVVVWTSAGLSFGRTLVALVFLGVMLTVVLVLYRRHVKTSVRQVLREEVMLEVQTQMSDYVPFEDSAGARHGGHKPLSF